MPKRKTVDKEYQDLTQDIDLKALHESIRAFFADFQDPRCSPIYPAWYLFLLILIGLPFGSPSYGTI